MRRLRHHLIESPSPLSWLLVLFTILVLVYLGIVVRDIFLNAEALMGLFVLPGAAVMALLLWAADRFTRKKLGTRPRLLWAVQLMLALPLLWYGWHRFLYRAEMHVPNTVKWVLLVVATDVPSDLQVSFFLQQTRLHVPADGIVFLHRPLSVTEQQHLQVYPQKGGVQPYAVYYTSGSYPSQLRCNAKVYNTSLYVIEDQPNRASPVTDRVLQTLYRQACRRLQLVQQ